VAMEDLSGAGMEAFRAEYGAARPVFRAHLEKQQPARLAAMVATAKAVQQGEK
jgi:hypothetical protein